MQLSTPHPDGPFLLGLAVFQNRQKSDHLKSFHIYKRESHLHTIQQEFHNKAGALEELCNPTHYAYVYDCDDAVMEYMETVRAKQREAGWRCLVDFGTTPPRSFHSLETALLVTNAWSIANTLSINANKAKESCSINGECSQCILPHLSACLKESDLVAHLVGNHMSDELTDAATQRLQLESWHQWGLDLELASPKVSKRFELPLLQNHSSNESNGGSGDTSSPLSSSLSGNNAESFLWTMQASSRQSPIMPNIIAGTQSDELLGVNDLGVAYRLSSPQSSFETLLGESSTNSSILANVLPLDLNQMALVNGASLPGGDQINGCYENLIDCGTSQPMSSASNTYSSGDERGFEEENIDLNSLTEVKFIGVQRKRKTAKLRKSSSSRAGSGRLSKLTKAELTRYFNMPITQASKELRIGLTVLKKRCRNFGIPRWPHRKMKSINGLIQNIQDLVKTDICGDSGKDSQHVQVAVEELEKQKQQMQECPSIQLPERTKRLRQACFKASYRRKRQAVHDHGALDMHNHQNAPAHVIYNNGSRFFYPHCD